MRVLAALSLLIGGAAVALAQEGTVERLPPPAAAAAKPAPAATAAKPRLKPKPKPKPAARASAPAAAESKPASAPATTATVKPRAPARPNLRASYDAIPLAERMAIQSDLTWTGDYNGLVNGEFSDRLVAAVKAFQKRNSGKDTGVLDPQQRAALAAGAKRRKDEVDWQVIEDAATGVRLGLPRKLATRNETVHGGTRWSSAQGQLQIETFSIRTGATLDAVFEQQKKEPATRKVRYSVLRPDFFVVSGMQGLKKLYVRAAARGNEVRGMTILYDQAIEGTMDRVAIAMSSAFAPFGHEIAAASDRSTPRRKVEYATGLVVSSAGHIATDRQAIDGCHIIVVAGHGNAERLAETGELALLRVYGARNLMPLALAGAASAGGNATLVGIADPQAQGGGAAVSSHAARISAAGGQRLIEPAPAPGFSGAAAVDPQGRFMGMVVQRPPLVAGPATATAQAALIPAETLIKLLEANQVAPSPGRSGVDGAKASAVRVICVRK